MWKAELVLMCWLWITPTSPGFLPYSLARILRVRAYRPSRWQRILFRSRLRGFRCRLLVMGFAVKCKTYLRPGLSDVGWVLRSFSAAKISGIVSHSLRLSAIPAVRGTFGLQPPAPMFRAV